MAERSRVAILASGRGSNAAALIYAARLDGCPFDIVLVGGDRPEAPALALARAEGIPVLPLDFKALGKSRFYAELDSALRRAGVDHVALAGFMRILPADFVERWAGRIVNIHPSLLPDHPGLDPHQKVLDSGDRRSGCTVHLVTAEVDGGPILGQVEVAVMPGDTPATLADRILLAEHQLYPRALAAYVTRETGA